MFLTCNEAVSWITQRRNQNMGLEHFKNFLHHENQVYDALKTIHVAGTNGKGSTCNFLCDCLMEAGYKVGTFTSPHLIAHQDRICINHQWIFEEDFLRIANERCALWEKYELNMFEIDFDLMTVYFHQQQVDYAIIEVGLGGRLDATNALSLPLASVIVSIGLDHMDRLGDTKEKIAAEKAGIIKEGGLVINGELEESSKQVIEAIARQKKAVLYNKEESRLINHDPLCFQYRHLTLTLSTQAQYQIHNASCACEVLLRLKEAKQIAIAEEQIKAGIKKSQWRGRFETIKRNPRIIVDGAHNEHGVHALVQSLSSLPKPLILLFAALKDKEYAAMIHQLHQQADAMIVTTFDFYRAADLSQLMTEPGLITKEDWKEAITLAVSLAGSSGTVMITGSLYFISEVIAYVQKS